VAYRPLRDAGGLSVQIGLVWRTRKAGRLDEAWSGPGLPDVAALAQCVREVMGSRSSSAWFSTRSRATPR
jgi:hypothetical protein